MDQQQRIGSTQTAVWLVVATLLGGVLRALNLRSIPLWLDESYTGLCARMIVEQGLSVTTTCDHISPGYYLLAVGAAWVTGDFSELSMRVVAWLAGVLTIPAMAMLARRLLATDAAVVGTAVATAMAPLLLRYSQEARGYSALLLLAVCYLILNWDLAHRGPSWWRFVGIFAVALGMVWLHTAALYLMVAVGLLLLWELKINKWPLWAWIGVHVVAGLTYVPFALATSQALINMVDNTLPGNPVPRLGFNTMAMFAGLTLGPTSQEVGELGSASAALANLPALGLIGVAMATLATALWVVRRQVDRTVWVWGAVLLIVPHLALLLSVYVSHVLLHVRYVITTWPVYGLAMGLVLAQLRRRAVAAVASALLIAVCAWSTFNYFFSVKYSREDVRQVPATLAEAMDDDDVLLIANDNVVVPLLVYGLECPADTIDMRNVHAFETLQKAQATPGGHTFVLVYRQWENTPEGTLNGFLDQTLAPPTHVWQWQGVQLQKRPGRLVAEPGPGLDHGCLYDS